LERVKCITTKGKLSTFLWVELIHSACCLFNRRSSKALGHKTPLEAYLGERHDIHNLKVLGMHAYVHALKIKRNKLDECSMVGILVGIDEMKKGYKCCILVLKKAILSKDVVIDE
jgi:hypothetical protein